MSFLSVDPVPLQTAAPVPVAAGPLSPQGGARVPRSLWITGARGRVVRAFDEHDAQVTEIDATGATIVTCAIFALGETVILTLNGLGHVAARVADRKGCGVRIAFEPEPDLAARVLAYRALRPAPRIL